MNLQGQQPQNIKILGQEDGTIDLTDWVRPYSLLGKTKYVNGELFMRVRRKGYYYVLVSPDNFTSIGHTSSVTLRNVHGAATRLGYGLIFHSDQTPLVQGYAFLIDTLRQRYRVVRHTPKTEKTLVQWVKSAAIKPGKEPNVLVVKDRGKISELYINGILVETVENTYAFKDGSPGLYTPAIEIAFKDFNVRP